MNEIEFKVGEVDSIYVEKSFRRQGIVNHLMKNILNWMNNQDVRQKIVVVVSGNEDVFSFYERYSFFPRTSTLVCKS
jgi:diamine N-acetyltransferase